eukprot:COSAG05_NODE_4403_length_1529_cov_1.497902_1_plen_188_part_10
MQRPINIHREIEDCTTSLTTYMMCKSSWLATATGTRGYNRICAHQICRKISFMHGRNWPIVSTRIVRQPQAVSGSIMQFALESVVDSVIRHAERRDDPRAAHIVHASVDGLFVVPYHLDDLHQAAQRFSATRRCKQVVQTGSANDKIKDQRRRRRRRRRRQQQEQQQQQQKKASGNAQCLHHDPPSTH